MQGPETRASLIRELASPTAQTAWNRFVQLYRPIVYRVALARGLQHADAEDLSQEVMVTVGRRIESFDPEGGGSFRGWLLKITRDLVVNKLTRRPKDLGTGDSNIMQLIAEYPEAEKTDTLFRMEHWRIRLHEVAETIREEFSDSVWNSFWMTAVEQRPISEVARELNKSEGAVRVARCRVLARIRITVDKDGCPFSL